MRDILDKLEENEIVIISTDNTNSFRGIKTK